jgi:hypothetical protein
MKKTILATICAAALAPLAALADADAPVATLVTDGDLAEYASISNGTVVIGENSITPVTGDTIGEHVSLSNNVLTVGGVSTSIQSKPEPNRIAMFIIPVNNESTDIVYKGFELKASTTNFTGATESDKLQFYAQSTVVQAWGDNRYWDGMNLYILTGENSGDVRRHTKIPNTQGAATRLTDVVVLVDFRCCASHWPGGTVGGSVYDGDDWLRDDNEDLIWCYCRQKANGYETEPTRGNSLWRPIAPVRWFSKWPSWAGEAVNLLP